MKGTMSISFIVRRRLAPPRETTPGTAPTFPGRRSRCGRAGVALQDTPSPNSSMKVSSWIATRSMSRAKRL
jgi:hypothetical protein